MGDPNTGEIYRGMLRKEGDVALNEEQAEWLKSLPVQDRMTKLQEMARKLQGSEVYPDLRELLKEPTTPVLVSDDGTAREIPRYKCHKEVWALKIGGIERDQDGSGLITPSDEGFAPFRVSGNYIRQHNPQTGGYFVSYKDGYQSYSPAQAFEEGYTRI